MKIEKIYEQLVKGLKNYLKKHNFSKIVLGISGGIDSAVACCIAKEAVGADNVLGIFMPGPPTSEQSRQCAEKLANNLGIKLKTIPIDDIYSCYIKNLKEYFEGKQEDTTEENIQARIRANILMAFSNKFGYFVLTTGNKSESLVGYCTLYGDTIGGLGVLADLYKTEVYKLADYINKDKEIIPKEIIERAPSAELKQNQKDEEALLPYKVLDKILYHYVDQKKSPEEIIKLSFDEKAVKKIIGRIKKNEFKRKQAPPALKITR